ncbi:universal stress protein [Syntrophorhabdus aromaticivorans]|jgi:nucleotide-binding universal stress UspA family protein|uniref:Universal stress protein n=1 Tax=Syntrophorhabdus aromaticivorans TaxID=328301 RepID=A0A351U3Q9_9BACT|nr:universal stress protein [Syntrophorhabdus aromaticivorans]NLW34110.1 universal stress protein [Syntrophorhabdus aromaticivorans]HBA54590.1 universal stress protein [Syntrophorhabdus aromaticivorans]
MHDIKKILVVSKSTEECKKAVHDGISLARSYKADLTILHVIYDPFCLKGEGVPIPHLADFEGELREIMKGAKKDLDAMIKAERAEGMHIKEIIREGEPAKTIVKTIQEEGADLMIMAAHEENRLEHFLFSRDNYKIIRKMPCSIMLVKVEPF